MSRRIASDPASDPACRGRIGSLLGRPRGVSQNGTPCGSGERQACKHFRFGKAGGQSERKKSAISCVFRPCRLALRLHSQSRDGFPGRTRRSDFLTKILTSPLLSSQPLSQSTPVPYVRFSGSTFFAVCRVEPPSGGALTPGALAGAGRRAANLGNDNKPLELRQIGASGKLAINSSETRRSFVHAG